LSCRICRGVAIIGRAVGLVGHIAEEMRNPIAYEIYERAEKEVAEKRSGEVVVACSSHPPLEGEGRR